MARDEKKVPETLGLRQLNQLLTGRNQKQLAAETDIAQSIISDIVNQKRLPSLQQALTLAKLGIEPNAWEESADQGAA